MDVDEDKLALLDILFFSSNFLILKLLYLTELIIKKNHMISLHVNTRMYNLK